jgi:hypothetical protein
VAAIATGMLWAVKTRRAPDRRPRGIRSSASVTFSACGSMKPGWLKNCRSLSIFGAPGSHACCARPMSSRYWRQAEYDDHALVTNAAARRTPSAFMRATASSTNGGAFLFPQ